MTFPAAALSLGAEVKLQTEKCPCCKRGCSREHRVTFTGLRAKPMSREPDRGSSFAAGLFFIIMGEIIVPRPSGHDKSSSSKNRNEKGEAQRFG